VSGGHRVGASSGGERMELEMVEKGERHVRIKGTAWPDGNKPLSNGGFREWDRARNRQDRVTAALIVSKDSLKRAALDMRYNWLQNLLVARLRLGG
jgi:hypothetical protein